MQLFHLPRAKISEDTKEEKERYRKVFSYIFILLNAFPILFSFFLNSKNWGLPFFFQFTIVSNFGWGKDRDYHLLHFSNLRTKDENHR